MRIRVGYLLFGKQQIFAGQIFDNFHIYLVRLVFGLNQFAGPIFNLRFKTPVHADMLNKRQLLILAQLEIIFTKSRSDVDNPRPLLGGHEVSRIHLPAILPIFQTFICRVIIKHRPILFTHQFLTLKLINNFRFLTKNRFHSLFGDNINIAGFIAGDSNIINHWIDGERHITRQSPRRSRPSEEIIIRLVY